MKYRSTRSEETVSETYALLHAWQVTGVYMCRPYFRNAV